jgi:hypothetical protein
MSYQKLLKQVAKEHNTTPKEVENEIKNAIRCVGYDIEPVEFIALISSKVKSELNK